MKPIALARDYDQLLKSRLEMSHDRQPRLAARADESSSLAVPAGSVCTSGA